MEYLVFPPANLLYWKRLYGDGRSADAGRLRETLGLLQEFIEFGFNDGVAFTSALFQ